MKLSLDKIKDWQEFENLVKDYFECVERHQDNNVTISFVQASGEGSDGGRDLLASFKFRDSITEYERKWVIQCKFYERSVSPSDLATTNIPGLIHQYGADGYLLVCKNNVTSGTSNMFEKWQKNCKFGYQYEFWGGSDFIRVLRENAEHLIPQYFINFDEKKSK